MENNEEKRNIDLSSLLTAFLSNPEALSKIGDTISKYTNNNSGDNSPPDSNNLSNSENTNTLVEKNMNDTERSSPTSASFDTSDFSNKFPELFSVFSTLKGTNNPVDKKQIALLLAIKPYLSNRRQELIDSFIKISQFSEILKKIT